MKPNKDDFFDSMDIDRDWIHTEVLGQGKKKSNIVSNLTVILVLICTVLLLFIAFKDMFKKDDLSSLENMDSINKEQQAADDLKKAQEDQAAKDAAAAEEAKKKEEAEVMVYTVKAGDALAAIGAQFNVDFKTIAEANDLKEPYNLEVGQQLKIPGVKKTGTTTDTTTSTTGTSTTTNTTSTATDSGQTYTVKSGDTLAAIAAQFGVSYQAIGELNSLAAPYQIVIGQVLKIPKK